jgi:hypothetical protein
MRRKVQRDRKRGANLEDIETQRTLHYCLCFAMRWKHRLVHVSVSMHYQCIENEQSARERMREIKPVSTSKRTTVTLVCAYSAHAGASRSNIAMCCSFLEVLGSHLSTLFFLPPFVFLKKSVEPRARCWRGRWEGHKIGASEGRQG